MSALLDTASVQALVTGVDLLGSGGGGDPRHLGVLLRRRLEGRSLPLHGPSEVAGLHVVPVGVVGATGVFLEKLPSGGELAAAVRAVCRWAGTTAGCIMSIEAGGLNGLTGPLAALDLGLPYLDADLMGRALPRLDQFSWAAAGLPITPCALAEPGGHLAVLDHMDPPATERAVRSFLSASGGWAALALAPTPVDVVRGATVVGTLQRALTLGRAHASLPVSPTLTAVEQALGARALASGRVREVVHHDLHRRAFSRGTVTVVDTARRTVVRVEAENEYLLALVDGRVAATTPDIICLLDRRTAQPVAVDRVRAGNEVIVIVLPGPTWWTATEDRMAVVGPEAFGYAGAHVEAAS